LINNSSTSSGISNASLRRASSTATSVWQAATLGIGVQGRGRETKWIPFGTSSADWCDTLPDPGQDNTLVNTKMFSKVRDSTRQLIDMGQNPPVRRKTGFYEDSMNSCLPKATKAV